MTAEADQIGQARVSLPGVSAYLKSVYELGGRSLRPALPALAFLFLCRLGLGAYLALADYSPQSRGAFGAKAAGIAGALLFPTLIYAPFLPLQESLLRGHPIDFPGAIRRVIEQSVNLTLSGIAQVFIILAPISPMAVVGARLLSDPFGPLILAAMAWLAVASFFMIFATPAVVLDGEGPLHSLRTSFLLVSRNLGSAFGRLRALAFLAAIAYVVATIPSSILGAAGRTSGIAATLIKLAVVTWTSAVNTLLYPFWVAAIIVLYRSLRPWADEGHS